MSAGATSPAVVVGAGVGGLVVAARLARRGHRVVVLEKDGAVGGKMRRVALGSSLLDAGPTVLTMRWVFDELFADAGERLDEHVALAPLECLARHAFADGSRLDLFADRGRSTDAIAAFAGAREARAYESFCAYAARIYEVVEGPFLRSAPPSLGELFGGAGLRLAGGALRIDPLRSMWKAIASFFRDPRLVMLFARYATYAGSSPLRAPATLNTIACVEQRGAWVVRGGMYALAEALRGLCVRLGVDIRTGSAAAEIELAAGRASGVRLLSGGRVAARAVITNGDVADLRRLVPAALASSLPAPPARDKRSLSALVMNATARASGFALEHHNVFFPVDYRREFVDLFEHRCVPRDPTVYVCAQDRGPFGASHAGRDERFLILINAPADGDATGDGLPEQETNDRWASKIRTRLKKAGLELVPTATTLTTPRDFARLFPATGGALYGPASHGMTAAFARSPARTSIPGLYAVGGSTHPGAGVPMVALSASLCAQAVSADLPSTTASDAAGTRGGTSMASATAAATR